ncbi:MAG: iron-containing alcohol dehydrogenase [Candidatus Paceibacterota bacterium]|jgi:alcohol dehydrogenase class IV
MGGNISYSTVLPQSIYSGACLNKLSEVLLDENVKKVIILTDNGVRKSGLIDDIIEQISVSQVPYTIIDDVKPEPSYFDVDGIVQRANNSGADMVIAVGGGSVMDSGKLFSLLSGTCTSVKDILKDQKGIRKTIKSIMIPTTCGTGSEATCNAIVAVPEEDIKVAIVNKTMLPDFVFLDPSLIVNLPQHILAATGVDALTHAVECYTSKKANPLSDIFALASAKLIFLNIKEAYSEASNMTAKENMLMGSFLGGAAITSSGTTAVHALSYPLGGKFHIPHGISNAILFKHVMEFNFDHCHEKLAMICDAINPSLASQNTFKRAEYILNLIEDIISYTQIPDSLRSYGVSDSDLDFIVNAAANVTRLLSNNCKPISHDDIRKIYNKVM